MQGRIIIEVNSDLQPNEFQNVDEELYELMVELGLCCEIYDRVTDNLITLE